MAKGLSRDVIVRAAFEVLDEAGMDGLTVRALADRLGVKAPALYWHVRDKQDLLDEMGTWVWREIGEQSALRADRDWRQAAASYARAVRSQLLAHRDGARAFSGTYLTDPGVLQGQEAGLDWMRGQGFSVEATTDAFAVVTAFVVGHCIEEQARTQAEDDRYSAATREARVGAQDHPLVVASGRHMLAEDADARFERLVDLVLDGVAGLRTGTD